MPRLLLRLRRADQTAARLAEHALGELLPAGSLAHLTQHDLQTYLWFTLADRPEASATTTALAQFLELAELNRYAAIAAAPQTHDILRAYVERGTPAGTRQATKAMDASGVTPPDLPELEWGEAMGEDEAHAYDRIATTLELALAAGELKPGGRGWRLTQQRLTRHQLAMTRLDGPPLIERIRAERLNLWADSGGHARRRLAGQLLSDLATEPPAPADLAERLDPMRWLLEVGAGRAGDTPGIPLTVGGNLARRVVQDAAERFGWWDLPDRPPRSESDIWRLGELRQTLQRAGALRRVGRRLVLGTQGRALLADPLAQWRAVTALLIDPTDFDRAVQETALMLLLQTNGMAEIRELIREVADVLAGSGWRDTGNGDPPDEQDVSRATWALIRRCQLWSLVDEGTGPGFRVRVRLSDPGRLGARAALRHLALRPRTEP